MGGSWLYWGYLGLQSVAIGGAVSYYGTRYWMAKERLAHAEAKVRLSEARQQLFLAGHIAGHITREREALREALRLCTCASSHAAEGRAADERSRNLMDLLGKAHGGPSGGPENPPPE